jgi:tripartite-type tricarboxylate transporter receptor subunit TctC
MQRRHAFQKIAAGLLALGAGTSPLTGWAQNWPTKPITLLVGFPAGGTTDVVARVIGNELSRRVGQPVVVDNKGGAGGTIAFSAIQAAPADGHTLMMLVIPTVNFFHFNGKKVDYEKDVEPLAEVYDQYNVLVVNPAVPDVADVRTLPQLVEKAKAKSGGLSYASSGVGSLGHLTMERISGAAGVRMQHVSYKGGAPAMNDLLGGQIGVMYADSQGALPHIRAGKLRAIAVSSATRQQDLPDVPTMSEQGMPGLVAVPWGGMVAPARTPKVVVDRISAEIKAILELAEVREKMRQAGVLPAYRGPADFGAFANRESAAWGKVITERGIKPE